MRKKEKHSCKENMKYNGEYQFEGNSVFHWGECSVCGKKLVKTFECVDTREADTDKMVE